MKSSSMVKIVLLSLLALFLLAAMIFGLLILRGGKVSSWFTMSFDETIEIFNETYDVSMFENIKVDINAADVIVKKSDDVTKVKVVLNVLDKHKEDFHVSIEKGSLNISENRSNGRNFCFGFCFWEETLTIYVPENYDKGISIKSTSGDINFEIDVRSNLNLKTTSGDIEVLNCGDAHVESTSGEIHINSALNGNIKTTSGDIEIVNALSVVLETTSGDINVGNGDDLVVNITSGDINIGQADNIVTETTSGDTKIKSARYVVCSSSSGLIKIEQVDGSLSLKTISGDVRINDAALGINSRIDTTSGDVEIDKINGIIVKTKTTSGDVRVNNKYQDSETILDIVTTSGDIRVG